MFDLAISGRNICTPEGMREGVVLVKDGIIVDILSGLSEEVCQTEINIGESVLMPGIIDPHVHINEPGRTDWEGFNTATRSAAAGGVTTLVDMPLNAAPVTTTADAFDKKLAATEGQLP